jgi:hypothetical protein
MEVEAAGGAGEPALAEAAEQVQADSAEEELGPEAAVEADEDDDSSNTSSSEGEPEWLIQEDEEARSMVFLVTYSALLHKEGDTDLVDPAEKTDRAEFRLALMDAIEHPVVDEKNKPKGGRPRTRPLAPALILTVREEHKNGKFHFQQAVKVSCETRFLPFKLALRQRSKLASHWSTSHTQLWSAVRYLRLPTEKKPVTDQDPDVWTSNGSEVNLFELSQEPWNSGALKRRREKAASAALDADQKPRKEAFGKLDLYAVIAAESLTTPEEVMAYVQAKGSLAMQAYVAKVQRQLQQCIDDANQWERASHTAAEMRETDDALIVRKAKGTCPCGPDGCEWWAAASAFFERNPAIDADFLAAALRKVIKEGPSKTARVPLIVGPRNAGKSTVLEPVDTLFGHSNVVHKPKLGASCPLGKLAKPGKRFIFFDDYRPVQYASRPEDNPTVSVTTFLALFCGQAHDVQLSQAFHDGHPEVVWRRGCAMTAEKKGLWKANAAAPKEEIRHMQARVLQFTADAVLPETEFRTIPKCAESFARWLLVASSRFAGRMPSGMGQAAEVRRVLLILPPLPEAFADESERDAVQG